MTDSLLLPPGTHLLHVGPHKTGTTAIQVALFESRNTLLHNGVYYPKRARRRRLASEELFASMRYGTPTPRWDALVDEVRHAAEPLVCISDEQLGKAPDALAARIVADLGGERPHVVAVFRQYDNYLPSQWQERVKAGLKESYDDWLRVVFDEHSKEWERRNVWESHSARLVERWASLVGPEDFTLIVADDRDRAQLLTVFSRLLGLPDATLQLAPGRSNESLVYADVELVRAVNRALAGIGLTRAEARPYFRTVVRTTASFDGPRPGPKRTPMPSWAAPLVREASDRRIEALERLPIRVVGDLEWLRSGAMDDEPVGQGAPTTPTGLAAAAVASVVERLRSDLAEQDPDEEAD